jgi:hypothetical protein
MTQANERPVLARPSGLTAEQVLYVLNGCQTVDLGELAACVIVAEHAPADGEPEPWPFRVGEFLFLDLSRMNYPSEIEPEFLGVGRDLSRWDMRDCLAWFDSDFESAWLLSRQLAEELPAGMYELSDGRYYRPSDQDFAYDRWCSDPISYIRVGLWKP